MPVGDVFTSAQLQTIQRAINNAEKASGLAFSLFVGTSEEDSKSYARRLHHALVKADSTVLILFDPGFRILEIVTGRIARRTLDDVECGLAAATMQTSFAVGDLAGGLVAGINQLGEAARAPKTLHHRGA